MIFAKGITFTKSKDVLFVDVTAIVFEGTSMLVSLTHQVSSQSVQ